MKAGMDNDVIEKESVQTPGLYCGVKGWKFYKADGEDPTFKGRMLSERTSESKQVPPRCIV